MIIYSQKLPQTGLVRIYSEFFGAIVPQKKYARDATIRMLYGIRWAANLFFVTYQNIAMRLLQKYCRYVPVNFFFSGSFKKLNRYLSSSYFVSLKYA